MALIDLGLAAATLVLVFRSRVWAATLAAAGLLVLGAYGWVIAAFWPVVPGFAYGFADLHNSPAARPALERRRGSLRPARRWACGWRRG